MGPSHSAFRVFPIGTGVAIPALADLYDDHALVHPFSDGSGVLVVDRKAAERGGETTYGVSVFSPDGMPAWSRRIPYQPIALPPGTIDELVSGIAGGFADRLGQGAAERSVREGMGEVAPFYSPIISAVAGYDGSIWLAQRGTDSTHVRWRVWDRMGADIGEVALPRRLRVAGAQSGSVWVIGKDDDDVPFVQRYHVR